MSIDDKPVAAQYESWVYPNPIMDMAEAIATGSYSDLSDPSRIRRKLWPKKVEPEELDILIAGCGANQAAYLAMKNPSSRVVGIDLSEASLAHEAYLKHKHGLHNLELRRLALEQAAALGQTFDLIVSTGVILVLPDPVIGLRSLGDVLKPHGVISLMLYGAYPRVGVNMLQEAFHTLGLQQDAAGIAMVKHTLLNIVPRWHHVAAYKDPDRGFDAGLVDTYLPARERVHTVSDIMHLVSESQLKFQGWLDNLDYLVAMIIPNPQDPLRVLIETLPAVEQWQCVELIGQALARHFFLVCLPDRPSTDYALDFTNDAWLDYVPSLRSGLQILGRPISEGNTSQSRTIRRLGFAMNLDPFESRLIQRIDGTRTIIEILEEEEFHVSNALQRVHEARAFFERMAAWDHLLYQIP